MTNIVMIEKSVSAFNPVSVPPLLFFRLLSCVRQKSTEKRWSFPTPVLPKDALERNSYIPGITRHYKSSRRTALHAPVESACIRERGGWSHAPVTGAAADLRHHQAVGNAGQGIRGLAARQCPDKHQAAPGNRPAQPTTPL